MNVLLYAIPLFFFLIAIELIVDRYRKTGYYRLNDAISSLNAGVLSRINDIAKKLIPLTIYLVVEENFALIQLEESTVLWIFAFVLYDFCYYWNHRIGHEINLFWAAHVVHHSSEEYNLTTALRQTSGSLFNWIFFLPMALLGIDVLILATVGALNLIYQFWVHSRHIPKLGWYEKFFVTPSNHRVHHATNDRYIDRNYGGVFIIWDRMFKTFQEEVETDPCMYGIRKPLKSWNPVWTNLHFYTQLFKDAYHAENWKDKLRIWFMPTGWRPEDVEKKYPLAKFNPETFTKFDVEIPQFNSWYSLIQHALMISITLMLMLSVNKLAMAEQLIWGGYIIASALGIGAVLQAQSFAYGFEVCRHLILPALVISFGYPSEYLIVAIVVAIFSLLLTFKLKPQQQLTDGTSPAN